MGSNTPRIGRRARTKKPDMWYYDQLPPTARAALANAVFDWSSGAVLNRWKRGKSGYRTGQEIAATIAAADRRHADK